MYAAKNALLALYSEGKTAGLVVGSEGDMTDVVACSVSDVLVHSYLWARGDFDAVALRQPTNIYGGESSVLATTIYDVIMKCDIKIRRELYENIYLFGSNTLDLGFLPDLNQDVKALAPSDIEATVKVFVPEGRELSVWNGAKALTGIPGFTDLCFTQADYKSGGEPPFM